MLNELPTKRKTPITMKNTTLFTDEYIIESCILKERASYAENVLLNLFKLNIRNKEVEAKCDEHLAVYKQHNKQSLDFMYSLIPEPLRKKIEELGIQRISGAFSSSITDRYAFSASFCIILREYTLNFWYDINTNKIYRRTSVDPFLEEEVNKYIEYNHSNDGWIRVKKFEG